ncbi:TM2 domain-containing protein [Aquirufa regiilacus]
MKISIKKFAQNIRDDYPGDYDDLMDDELVELWLRKYPEDGNKIKSNSNQEMASNNLYLSNSIVGNLPAMVRNELAKLSSQKQEEFLEEYERNEKSIFVGYLFWLFFGWHYAYQKKWGIQVLFWITAGGLFIWWLIDIFRVSSMINNYNKDKAIEVMRNLRAITR